MAAQPRGTGLAFVSPLGHQIEVVVGAIDHVDAAGIGGIGVKDVSLGVFEKDAGSLSERGTGGGRVLQSNIVVPARPVLRGCPCLVRVPPS